MYVDFGFFKEHLISLTKKGIEGANEIKQMMVDLRDNPVSEINGQRVIMVEDYQNSTAKNLLTDEVEALTVPKSNVLIYYLNRLIMKFVHERKTKKSNSYDGNKMKSDENYEKNNFKKR